MPKKKPKYRTYDFDDGTGKRKPLMPGQKAKYREVTLYIRDDETLEEYLANAREGYFAEEELKKMMKAPQVPFEDLLRDLGIIQSQSSSSPKKTKTTRRSSKK